MTVIASGVNGVLTPGQGIALSGAGAAEVPLTGVCSSGVCESYGGQCQSTVALKANTPVSLGLSTAGCAAQGGAPPTSSR